MAKTEAQKRAQKRYVESHPEVIREIWMRQEAKGRVRDRAAYMRERRARLKAAQQDQPEG